MLSDTSPATGEVYYRRLAEMTPSERLSRVLLSGARAMRSNAPRCAACILTPMKRKLTTASA